MFVEEIFVKNTVLKSYQRFKGSGGDLDYLEVFKNKDIKVGVKFALETGYNGTQILCRIRIVPSGNKDIFNLASFAEEKYGEHLCDLKKFGNIQNSNTRASVCITGEHSLEKLGGDLAVEGAKIIKGFNNLWRDVTKRSINALKIVTFGDKASLDHMLRISHALNSVYCPELPPAREKADVVDIKSGNGNGSETVDPPHPDEAKGKPEPKVKAKSKAKAKTKTKTKAKAKTKKAPAKKVAEKTELASKKNSTKKVILEGESNSPLIDGNGKPIEKTEPVKIVATDEDTGKEVELEGDMLKAATDILSDVVGEDVSIEFAPGDKPTDPSEPEDAPKDKE